MMIKPAALRKPRAERQQKPRSQRVPGLLESHIQQTVTDFLQLDGWRAFRTEHAIERSNDDERRFKRKVGERGQPDYLYIRYVVSSYARALWIEFKRPGERPRPDQLMWHEAERKRGALVMVVDDIDQFIGWYKTSGLQRR
jgi:hypothetical protein